MSSLIIFTFIALSFFISITSCMGQKPITLASWAKTEPYGHEYKTTLQFYFHDVILGENPTSFVIAEPLHDNKTGLRFGSLLMADEPLTISPDRNSKLLGRAQGFFGRASQNDRGLIMGLAYGFLEGIYNGSTIIVFGRNPIMNQVRELPVVGGTGLFRMARGYAVAKTVFSNPATFSAIVKYDVTVFHPQDI